MTEPLPRNGNALVLVVGVGPGTGSAVVRRFDEAGCRVVALARSKDVVASLEKANRSVHGFTCDVRDQAEVDHVLGKVRDRFGSPDALVYNAVGGARGSFLEIDPSILELNFQTNVMGLLHFSRGVAREMVARGSGAIIVTGNTSARRGKASFAGFAPTKAAQRILAESMARELGPKGVHVAYVLIDAVIDTPAMRARMPEKPDEFFIRPSAIADEIWHIYRQERSAWSFLSEIRPYAEVW